MQSKQNVATTVTGGSPMGNGTGGGPEKFIGIGEFEIVSNKIVVGDPCYGRGDRRAKTLRNVRGGTWRATVVQCELGPFGLRNVGLICEHDSVDPFAKSGLGDPKEFTFDVDSGTAGMFDAVLYDGTVEDGRTPHADCGAALYSEHEGVVIAHGAASVSGLGDWRYDGHAFKSPKGQIVAVYLVFYIPGLMSDLASAYGEKAGIV